MNTRQFAGLAGSLVIEFDDIKFASWSDVGIRRSHNQDAFAAMPAADVHHWQRVGHFFLVADGMGAHAVGELASKLAADTIPHIYSKHAEEGAVAALQRAFVETNELIYNRGQQNREFEGMGTTASALVIRPEGAWIGHVGDSRVYRIRAGRIEQLSFDHSLLWEMARRARKPPEQMKGVPPNVIVRSLGPEAAIQPDVEGPHEILPGDRFVLCSDGLSGPVTDREIGCVVSALNPEEACRFLIHLANLQGGPDNITAIVISAGTESAATVVAAPVVLSRSQRLRQLGRRVNWPVALLGSGTLFSILAIVLTILKVPGAVFAFVSAALMLLGGLAALIWETFRETKEVPVKAPGTHIYRNTDCILDSNIIGRLASAAQSLQPANTGTSRDKDAILSQQHLDLAAKHLADGKLAESFREYCMGMMVMMESISKKRHKEESFRPVWDKART